jgi:hypothetical protein
MKITIFLWTDNLYDLKAKNFKAKVLLSEVEPTRANFLYLVKS